MTLATRRAAYFLAAPLLCLAVFWRAPLTWFMNDDFAWLGLPLEVHSLRDLVHVVLTPQAEGTVRVFSERLFFLTFSSLFGLNPLPYRIWVLGTWFIDLGLAAVIGARLTGSRAAGLFAALLWTTSSAIVRPLAWASAYNQVLCGFFLLAAFYARLRNWKIAEWAAYLAGFGALEVIVMYPAVALLHAVCTRDRRWRGALPLFIPAILFAYVDLFFIPKTTNQVYRVAVDSRLPSVLGRYLGWALGPSRMGGLVGPEWRVAGFAATVLIGVGLAVFAAGRLRQGQFIVAFFCGWFVLLLAPVLALPNHVTDYYLTLPVLGLAWLGGWAIATAWSAGAAARTIACVVAGLYVCGSIAEIDSLTDSYLDSSTQIEDVVEAVEATVQQHPGAPVLLQGVDNELFQTGFQDKPFRLVGAPRVYLTPGSEKDIDAREDLGGTSQYRISPEEAVALLDQKQARVLSISDGGITDVTRRYGLVVRAQVSASRRNFVNVGEPAYASRLGPTWHPAESGYRWMPKTATVLLGGPRTTAEKLYVTGFAAAPALASGPVTLHFKADGRDVGSATLRNAGELFTLEFPLPAGLMGKRTIEISIEASKVLRQPGDLRELGMVLKTFEIR